MGNNIYSQSLEEFHKSKNLTLKMFQEATPRKMTIHILSNNIRDCANLVEFLIEQKIKKSELLEKNIKKKKNLFCFMNYKIYEDADLLNKQIEKKVNNAYDDPINSIFSEVVIILDNDKLKEQIDKIKEQFQNNTVMENPYYVPFLIIISPKKVDLKDFLESKTFHYKITLKDVTDLMKEKEKNKLNNYEVLSFSRRLNVLFCYYNELGDEFSFMNSDKEEELIKIEDDTNITIFINILFMGRTGAGKSTLINLILGEKKSIEGGNGFSTTSKNIIVYKKNGVPIRLYDVKGVENEETIENYAKILTNFNGKNSTSNDSIHAIFYCIEYKTGSIIEKMENKLFEKLINFDIQIIFVITKTPYDVRIKHKNKKTEKARESERNRIKNAIKSLIKNLFQNEKKADEFLNNYVQFFFVNLIRNYSLDVPVFGIDKVLSFFSKRVPREDWEGLEKSCFERDVSKCKEYCEKNPFLMNYSEFEKLNIRNQEEAKEYMKGLKAGAFFSGMIPGVDIGFEYFYKKKFKNKLKALYGFDYNKAQNVDNKEKTTQEEKEILLTKEEYLISDSDISQLFNNSDEEIDLDNQSIIYDDENYDKRTNNTKKEEAKIESEIKNGISNVGKNTSSIVRGVGEICSIVLNALPTAGEITLETGTIVARTGISIGLKVASWALLPVTCIAFGSWSLIKVHNDCNKILEIFKKAFTPLRFETLFIYTKTFRKAIQYLELIGQKLIKEDEENNNDNSIEEEK